MTSQLQGVNTWRAVVKIGGGGAEPHLGNCANIASSVG